MESVAAMPEVPFEKGLPVARYSLRMAVGLAVAVLALSHSSAQAQVPRGPAPWQHLGGFGPGHGGGHGGGYGYQRPFYGHDYPRFSTNYNYGWLQRPYPYHLDYYRMKYGGSYEPYMGNIYGPPVFNQYYAPAWPNFTGAYYW